MRGPVGLVIAALSATGCSATGTFACDSDPACGAGGRCEPAGFCSFEDATCGSGRRYDEYAGDGLSGVCVDPMPLACGWTYTPSNVDPCDDALGAIQPALHPPVGDYVYDTTDGSLTFGGATVPAPTSTMYLQTGGPTLRVLNLDGLTLDSGTTFAIRGVVPLVVVVHGAVELAASIRVESGPADASLCTAPGTGANATSTSGGGGGGGGAFGGVGGAGGTGGAGQGGGTGGAVAGDGSLVPLRGGCPGARGGATVNGEPGDGAGAGGGALQVIAKDTLVVTGTLDAGGQKGSRGASNASGAGGGGGGGAGGAVFLEANEVTVDATARLCANGGAGGEGSDASEGGEGSAGSCSDMQGATSANLTTGGDGGSGGFATTPGGTGGNGTMAIAGGGGGGGGVGRIRVHGATARTIAGGAVVTPAATP
ncbi:MAG TPA: hypothetical protein VFQ53_30380 [Kofleriaceae bacterium]|nr:hypothetical protein [Kofleriaceae bacterium]